MGNAQTWLIDIILPAILLIILILLVMTARSSRSASPRPQTAEGTRELHSDEKERRREGTDKL